MKTMIMAIAALSTLAAAPALAQTASIDLGATVTPACGIGSHKSGAAAAAGWDQNDITVTLADGNGQFGGATFNNRSFGNLWCNGSATVSMSVSSLASATASTDTGSFTNSFNVRVTTDMGVYFGQGENAVLTSSGATNGNASGNTAGAFETGLQRFSGVDSIEVLADASGRRPVAGTYVGSVSVTVSPQP